MLNKTRRSRSVVGTKTTKNRQIGKRWHMDCPAYMPTILAGFCSTFLVASTAPAIRQMTRLIPTLALALMTTPVTAGDITAGDARDSFYDEAINFILVYSVEQSRSTISHDIKFDEHPTGAENALACGKQIRQLFLHYGAKGGAVEAFCMPMARGDLE